ncbi:hypothetical protein ACQP00_19615 [Dactylosporangium sp. CS-047395]|uniref:hypothetical protein n=1 Tax=Dactylosporangium sp. CS-047395 TaxID=3239936 RepID=UPI003D915AC9
MLLGSLARREPLLLSDVDTALVWGEPSGRRARLGYGAARGARGAVGPAAARFHAMRQRRERPQPGLQPGSIRVAGGRMRLAARPDPGQRAAALGDGGRQPPADRPAAGRLAHCNGPLAHPHQPVPACAAWGGAPRPAATGTGRPGRSGRSALSTTAGAR